MCKPVMTNFRYQGIQNSDLELITQEKSLLFRSFSAMIKLNEFKEKKNISLTHFAKIGFSIRDCNSIERTM